MEVLEADHLLEQPLLEGQHKMKKGDLQIDKLAIWLLALLVLLVLLFLLLQYKDKLLGLVQSFGNLLRFGGG